jgi:hypothetical protein
LRKLTQEYKDLANNFNFFIKERRKYNEPFEVELIFDVGRLGNSFLFFDSIVSHYVFFYVLKKKFFNISVDYDDRLHIDIPIEKKFFDSEICNHEYYGKREYFYLCGGIFDIPDKVSFVTKKTEHPIIPIIKNKKIRVNAGTFKNYKFPVLYSVKKKYIIRGVGDIELLEKVLPKKMNIGKKTSIGYGQYTLKIKKIDKLKLFDNETRHYIRPIPIEYLKQKNMNWISEKIYNPIRPPYYGKNCKYYECYL